MFTYSLFRRIKRDLDRIETRVDWSLDDLADIEVLVILLEDRRFFQHFGVDVLAIVRELLKMISFRKFGGASTIDMQFVRTRTGYKQKTFRRKIYEIMLAILLQRRMSKIDILRAYLQEVYLGSSIYGISRAAKVMFDKEIYDLSLGESAVIAAMMVYPRPLHPGARWAEKIRRRSEYGLKLFAKFAERYKRKLS